MIISRGLFFSVKIKTDVYDEVRHLIVRKAQTLSDLATTVHNVITNHELNIALTDHDELGITDLDDTMETPAIQQ